MLGSASGIAFIPSTDLDRAREFFAGRLGLEVLEITPFACVLNAGGTTVRVTKVDPLRVQPFTVFGWEVPDIRQVMAELVASGIGCLHFEGMGQDDAGIWTTPTGDLISWFQDPDGNTLSLTQSASRRPS
jgi:catechol 2,3-dioxygenase-like lactoylglutathione lyase family enzyme